MEVAAIELLGECFAHCIGYLSQKEPYIKQEIVNGLLVILASRLPRADNLTHDEVLQQLKYNINEPLLKLCDACLNSVNLVEEFTKVAKEQENYFLTKVRNGNAKAICKVTLYMNTDVKEKAKYMERLFAKYQIKYDKQIEDVIDDVVKMLLEHSFDMNE